MLHRIRSATAHQDHTVTVTWSDGVTAIIDPGSVVGKGNVFAPMQDADFFVSQMAIANDRMGLEWPGHIDFSADGLRFRAFPEEAASEFGTVPSQPAGSLV